ncbi:MAG: hypothetical protein KDA42_05615 [Planctomycetales bacterium]|nr:hypothetical protein [Planctomycetales bacterium]
MDGYKTPNSTRRAIALSGAMLALFVGEASAQRVQFPSTVTTPTIQNNSAYAPSTFAETPTYSTPAPNYGGPGVTYSGPAATLNGTITPPPMFDPYQDPSAAPPGGTPYYSAPGPAYSASPPALFPNGLPTLFAPNGYALQEPVGTFGQYQRLTKEIRLEHTWLYGDGNASELDVHTSEISGTMQFPFLYNSAPLLVTPGFALQMVEAPGMLGLPPRLYDAYLDGGWQPQLTPWLSADLGVRVGVYSDFDHTTTDSVRYMGRGLGVLSFTPTVQVALGVVYFDRVDLKLLPAGGIIWTPHPDARYEILFPRPRLARRLTTIGTTEWWVYAAGEYGGGSWTVRRDLPGGAGTFGDRFDINDLRAIGGIEFRTLAGFRGHFEVGYVFDREVVFADSPGTKRYSLDDTFMLRGGVSF